MKALNCKNKILLAILLLAGTGLYAQEVKKELHEEFSTSKSTVLNIDGKFCELTIKDWDKDQAVFDVTIKAKHSNESKSKKMLDKINVNIEQDGNEIVVETELDKDFSMGNLGKEDKFSIVIVASVPSYINLEVDTKFGSADLGSFSGNADISTSFGATEVEQLSGPDVSVSISHGDFTIGKISEADVELNFGSLNIIKAGNLSLEVKQGEAKIGSVRNLSAEVSMGNCEIDLVDPSFETIDVEMKNGNVAIGVDRSAGFTIDAEMRMGELDIPKDIGNIKKDKMGMNASFEGKYGNGKSEITLEGNLGNIELKLK